MEIKDSGERRQFDSGAVRDVADGKGRCDLLPLSIISRIIGSTVFDFIDKYIRTGDVDCLYSAIKHFAICYYEDYCSAILEVAKHYEDGAKKYAERNWEQGIPLHCYIDSGIRHYLKFQRGDTDEPHDRAFLWNMLGAIWTHINKPEMIDLPFKEEKQ